MIVCKNNLIHIVSNNSKVQWHEYVCLFMIYYESIELIIIDYIEAIVSFVIAWVCNNYYHKQRHMISSFAQQTRLHATTSSIIVIHYYI